MGKEMSPVTKALQLLVAASLTFGGAVHSCNRRDQDLQNPTTRTTIECEQGKHMEGYSIYFDPQLGEFVIYRMPHELRFNDLNGNPIRVATYPYGQVLFLNGERDPSRWNSVETTEPHTIVYKDVESDEGGVLMTIGDPQKRVMFYGSEVCVSAGKVFLRESKK